MPYSMDNMPDSMKGAPKQAMEIFVTAFNAAFEKSHIEGAAMAIAMAAVHKAGYKKDEQGYWVSTAGGGMGGGNHSEWDPVFRIGLHTDSEGNTKNWTLEELDTIVAKYHPAEHEPPVVIGHPEHNSPAWGWVAGLKREGELLYAKYKDLIPEFVDMVKRGFYKKKSISLYPDLTLRHIGFLGAMPPAVKGIPNTAFNADKKAINIEFGDIDPKSKTVRAENLQPLHFGREAKRMKWFDWMKKKAADEGVTIEDAPSFSESGRGAAPAPSQAEIQAQVNAEVAKLVGVKNAEFAEAQKTLDAEKARLKAEGEKLEKTKGERMKDEIKSFCEGLCEKGKLTPAMTKYGMGMTNFLEAISGIQTQYDFSEPTEGKKLTPAEHIKGFLSCFKKQIEFSEFAGTDKDIPRGDDKREAAIRNYQEKNSRNGVEITYKEAVLAVSKQQPELFKN